MPTQCTTAPDNGQTVFVRGRVANPSEVTDRGGDAAIWGHREVLTKRTPAASVGRCDGGLSDPVQRTHTSRAGGAVTRTSEGCVTPLFAARQRNRQKERRDNGG